MSPKELQNTIFYTRPRLLGHAEDTETVTFVRDGNIDKAKTETVEL